MQLHAPTQHGPHSCPLLVQACGRGARRKPAMGRMARLHRNEPLPSESLKEDRRISNPRRDQNPSKNRSGGQELFELLP